MPMPGNCTYHLGASYAFIIISFLILYMTLGKRRRKKRRKRRRRRTFVNVDQLFMN